MYVSQCPSVRIESPLTCLRRQHGSPLQVVDMGETAIDEETFDEYLEEIREHYTADKVSSPSSGSDILVLTVW